MIKELIPMVGHKTRFISNLEQWKIIIQGISNMNTDMVYIVYIVIFYLNISIIKIPFTYSYSNFI